MGNHATAHVAHVCACGVVSAGLLTRPVSVVRANLWPTRHDSWWSPWRRGRRPAVASLPSFASLLLVSGEHFASRHSMLASSSVVLRHTRTMELRRTASVCIELNGA